LDGSGELNGGRFALVGAAAAVSKKHGNPRAATRNDRIESGIFIRSYGQVDDGWDGVRSFAATSRGLWKGLELGEAALGGIADELCRSSRCGPFFSSSGHGITDSRAATRGKSIIATWDERVLFARAAWRARRSGRQLGRAWRGRGASEGGRGGRLCLDRARSARR